MCCTRCRPHGVTSAGLAQPICDARQAWGTTGRTSRRTVIHSTMADHLVALDAVYLEGQRRAQLSDQSSGLPFRLGRPFQ